MPSSSPPKQRPRTGDRHDVQGLPERLGELFDESVRHWATSSPSRRDARRRAWPPRRELGIREEFGHRAGLHEPPGLHDGGAMADPRDHLEFMGDQQNREAQLAVEPREQVEDLVRRVGVERARGLVRQQHRRLGGERPGDRQALALPARELPGVGLRLVREAHEVEQFERPFAPGGARRPPEPQRQGHIGRRVAVRQEVEVLEDHRGLGPRGSQLTSAQLGQLDAVDLDRARVGPGEEVDGAQERRLAGAGASEDAEDLAGGDVEVDRVQRDQIAEALGHTGQTDAGSWFHREGRSLSLWGIAASGRGGGGALSWRTFGSTTRRRGGRR